MTPKEKALDLFNQHYMVLFESDSDCGQECLVSILAKSAAIVTANEIIKQWDYIDTYIADDRGGLNPNLRVWYKIKEEIEKL